MHSPHRSTLLLLGIAAGLTACVSGEDPFEPSGPCDVQGDERFLPVIEGATWTYETTDLESGVVERRDQVVGPIQEMTAEKAGVIASPLITEKETGTIINWQEDTGDAVVRHRQEDRAGNVHRDDLYLDYKGRLDESPDRLVEGATYSHSYTARTVVEGVELIVEHRVEHWEVVSTGEEVEVPAGTFCAMQITRQRDTDGQLGKVKQYWFARGVGKVMDRSEGAVETLTAFSVPE
jgi:hypothetical protein